VLNLAKNNTEKWNMKMLKIIPFIVSTVFLVPLNGHADEDFYGIIEKIPEGKTGTWVIGDRQIAVTKETRLEEEHGPLAVGACAEVEYEGGVVEEIESEAKYKCGK
jgi:hypothetical protein